MRFIERQWTNCDQIIISSHRRRPVPIVEIDPGLRRDDDRDRTADKLQMLAAVS